MILQIYGSYGNDTTQRAPRRSVTVSEIASCGYLPTEAARWIGAD